MKEEKLSVLREKANLGNVVRVSVPAKVAFDLASMQKGTASSLDRFGCPACHSGLDIRFDTMRDFVVNERLDIREIAGGVVVTDG